MKVLKTKSVPAVAFALRELRTGTRGFRVFLACLAIGVGAITAIGTVRDSIESGLRTQGKTLLGGDAEITFSYRLADEAERDWMSRNSAAVSEIVQFRSMAAADSDGKVNRALISLKGVDGNYPLYGSVELSPDIPLAEALAVAGGLPGAVIQEQLALRLDLEPGDIIGLGTGRYRVSAILVEEPDASGLGGLLAPRVIVPTKTLEDSGFLGPGSQFNTSYRLMLPQDADLEQVRAETRTHFANAGAEWRDRNNPDPRTRFAVERVSAFLVLAGLAGLAVGGIGIASAVVNFLDGKTNTIATLKTLGASSRTVSLTYGVQIGAMTVIGVCAGVAMGAAAIIALESVLVDRVPLPIDFAGVRVAPILEAALYGVLIAAVFSLWPLSRVTDVRAAALYRRGEGHGMRRLRLKPILATVCLVLTLVGSAAVLSGVPAISTWTAAGVLASLAALAVVAAMFRRFARQSAGWKSVRGWPVIRLALASVGGPTNETRIIVMSLGLGLSVLAAIGQISSNLNAIIENDLPDVAPSFFLVDIQNDQLEGLLEMMSENPSVDRIETAPMLRGFLTRINGRDASEVAGNHWVLRGDRGITYSTTIPPNTVLTDGQWWPEGYEGPPQVSFSAEEALELGLGIGDVITINVLGRDIDARISSLREVDFSTVGIGFIMAVNPSALAGAPHTHIGTVYVDDAGDRENAVFESITTAFPNVTVIGVKDGIRRIARLLAGLVAAVTYAASGTLVIGFIVLVGAATAGEAARSFEAAVLRTVGASRIQILRSFALRSTMSGLIAAVVAVLSGSVAGWAVMRFVMESEYRFEAMSACVIVLGGTAVTVVAGLLFSLGPIRASPAQVLRQPE